MNMTKQKQTHRYRKQTSGYHWGERGRWRSKLGEGIGTNYQLENKSDIGYDTAQGI